MGGWKLDNNDCAQEFSSKQGIFLWLDWGHFFSSMSFSALCPGNQSKVKFQWNRHKHFVGQKSQYNERLCGCMVIEHNIHESWWEISEEKVEHQRWKQCSVMRKGMTSEQKTRKKGLVCKQQMEWTENNSVKKKLPFAATGNDTQGQSINHWKFVDMEIQTHWKKNHLERNKTKAMTHKRR